MSDLIRLAVRDDIPQIVEITNREARRSAATVSSADEPLERWLESYDRTHEYYPWLVASNAEVSLEQSVIAYAKAAPYHPREGFLWSVTLSIYIDPKHQGKGLGIRLYEELFALLKAQGYCRVYARIALPNPASERLHQRFGLTHIGTFPQFAWKFDRWHDMGIYIGSLRPQEPLHHLPSSSILSVSQAQLERMRS